MNKLVIVGNGFDLAHGLPTSYLHFINHFWATLNDNYKNSLTSQIVEINIEYSGILEAKPQSIKGYEDFKNHLIYRSKISGFKIRDDSFDFQIKHNNGFQIFGFKNEFFKIITFTSINNWVEIENIYYDILKKIIKKDLLGEHVYPFDIVRLNKEFNEIKELLENYLKTEINDKTDFKIFLNDENAILDLFKIRHHNLKLEKEHPIFYEFPKEDYEELIEFDEIVRVLNSNQENDRQINDRFDWPKALFLDFNYTNTVESYVEKINSKKVIDAYHIQIHGKISSAENKINFGFGDEMDEDYKMIERHNNNSFLTNIKSFQYLHNSNYRKLLNWIESSKFQVYIFGHSCGLSDRTLLNTIFENNNCRSIRIFYHIRKDDDNFTELTQNISRHFNKKALMRSKIVDKSLSIGLDQTIRFKTKK